MDEEVVAPAHGVTLTRMVVVSGGKSPHTTLDGLLAELADASRRPS